jgi:hypothetical protein
MYVPSDGNNNGAANLSDLNGSKANASSCTKNQQYLSRSQMSPVDKCHMRGSVGNRKRTCAHHITSLWYSEPSIPIPIPIYKKSNPTMKKFQTLLKKERMIKSDRQMGLVDNDELSKGAEVGDGTNGVSDLELRNIGTHSIDDSRVVGTWDEGQGRLLLVRSLYLQVIGVVQTGGFHPDPHCRGRIHLRDRVVLDQHYRGIRLVFCGRITQFPAQHCFHFFVSFLSILSLSLSIFSQILLLFFTW